jgi:hypothetical protein
MCEVFEILRRKGVDDRDRKQDGSDDLQGGGA